MEKKWITQRNIKKMTFSSDREDFVRSYVSTEGAELRSKSVLDVLRLTYALIVSSPNALLFLTDCTTSYRLTAHMAV
jgi:hypothetical protein